MSQDSGNKRPPHSEGDRSGGNEIKGLSENIEPTELFAPESNNAIKGVYANYNVALHRFLTRRLDSKEDVDDVAQEVYFRVVRDYRPGRKLTPAYVFKIASNLVIDFFRKRQTHATEAHFLIDDVQLASKDPSPEQVLRSKQGVEAFRRVLKTLNPTCRRAFLLHRFRGLTYAEIALAMGISKIAVKNHIYQALFQFRKKIPERL